MDFYESEYSGLPKITTIPSSDDPINTQSQTPISSNSLCQKIPTIDEILNGVSQPPYTRNQFLQYLLQRHCLENLEFYLEIEKFLNLSNLMERQYNWKFLFDNFIQVDSPKEINLPCSIRDKFDLDQVPESQQLIDASKIVFDYLHENYVCFLSQNNLNYTINSPIPIRRQSNDTRRDLHCMSPLSPSESTRTTPVNIINEDTEFLFLMSDDDTENTDLNVVSSTIRKSSISSNQSKNFNIVGSLKNDSSTSWKKLGKIWKWRRSSNSSNE